MFKENIDSSGRITRLIIAIVLLLLALWLQSWIILFFALFTFFEAYMSWCIVYQILGKSSCPVDRKK